jgi:hypothetical protein
MWRRRPRLRVVAASCRHVLKRRFGLKTTDHLQMRPSGRLGSRPMPPNGPAPLVYPTSLVPVATKMAKIFEYFSAREHEFAIEGRQLTKGALINRVVSVKIRIMDGNSHCREKVNTSATKPAPAMRVEAFLQPRQTPKTASGIRRPPTTQSEDANEI